MERENVLLIDLIPDEMFRDLLGSNVEAIPFAVLEPYQKEYPDYNWDDLAKRGNAILNPALH